jgi:hypothetical protein
LSTNLTHYNYRIASYNAMADTNIRVNKKGVG